MTINAIYLCSCTYTVKSGIASTFCLLQDTYLNKQTNEQILAQNEQRINNGEVLYEHNFTILIDKK